MVPSSAAAAAHSHVQHAHVSKLARLFALAGALLVVQHGLARAEPSTRECLNANDRSITLRNQHQLRAARTQLLICATPSCPQEVRDECVRRIGEVNAQLPTIVFEAKDPDGNDVSAVSVTLDGQPWVDRLDGTALQLDPGEHQFVFKTLDGPSLSRHWIIREGEKGRRELVVLGAARRESPTPSPAQPRYDPVPKHAIAVEPSSSHATQRVLGVIVGGLGIAGLGVALYEEIVAHSRASSSQSAADSLDPRVRDTSSALYEQAKQAQTYAIIFGAAGAVALGTGLVLFITGLGDSDSRETATASQHILPAFGRDGGGLQYVATF